MTSEPIQHAGYHRLATAIAALGLSFGPIPVQRAVAPVTGPAFQDDWPMARHDPMNFETTAESVRPSLGLSWSRATVS